MRHYLDHNATSPLRSEVREAFLSALDAPAANASSLHAEGRFAKALIEAARANVAALAGSTPREVVFTSGGSEAIAAALADLSRKHRDTPMAGRSNLQQAVPLTFGFKCACLLAAMQRHRARLRELRPRVLAGEFGGAVGTLASIGFFWSIRAGALSCCWTTVLI